MQDHDTEYERLYARNIAESRRIAEQLLQHLRSVRQEVERFQPTNVAPPNP